MFNPAKHLSNEYRVAIMQRLRTFEPEEIRAAIALSDSFPAPGDPGEDQDDVAQTLHDIALHAESLEDWDSCVALYNRALGYPVRDIAIHAGSAYRKALCLENKCSFGPAMSAYRVVLDYPDVWPEVAALSRFRLAGLLMCAEDYEPALTLLSRLAGECPLGDLQVETVQLMRARCLVQLKQWTAAREVIDPLVASAPPAQRLSGMELSAYINEKLNDRAAAIECYRRIVEDRDTGPLQKSLALTRLAVLSQTSAR